MHAQNVMSTRPLSIPIDGTAHDALLIMSQADIRHLPVVDQHGCVLGILSDRDLTELPRPQFAGAPLAGSLKTPLSSAVNVFMSQRVFSVTGDVDVISVIDLMLEHSVDAIPVVDTGNHLIGIVTATDILKHSRTLL